MTDRLISMGLARRAFALGGFREDEIENWLKVVDSLENLTDGQALIRARNLEPAHVGHHVQRPGWAEGGVMTDLFYSKDGSALIVVNGKIVRFEPYDILIVGKGGEE